MIWELDSVKVSTYTSSDARIEILSVNVATHMTLSSMTDRIFSSKLLDRSFSKIFSIVSLQPRRRIGGGTRSAFSR